MDQIIVRGAREHNLKNLDVDIPRDRLTVITGLSGSGKSSLAFDTIYAEGQRRYVESLSSYARQFLGRMDKPDADLIDGLSPAISIEQKTTSHNPRSTVGTVTEIYDYFRLLFARTGEPHCYQCGRPIKAQSAVEIVDRLLALPQGTRLMLLAPVVAARKGEHAKLLENLKKEGFARIRLGKEFLDLSEEINLDKKKKHNIAVVVDRLVIKEGLERRLTDSVELTLKTGEGVLTAAVVDEKNKVTEELFFSERFACDYCGLSFPDLTPQLFSFNSPLGACPDCDGLGGGMFADPQKVIPNWKLSLADGAVAPYTGSYSLGRILSLAEHYGWRTDIPAARLPQKAIDIIMNGSGRDSITFYYTDYDGDRASYSSPFEGVLKNLTRLYQNGTGQKGERLQEYMTFQPCPVCGGARLRPEARAVTVGGRSISYLCGLPVGQCLEFFEELRLDSHKAAIGERVIKEIGQRLGFLRDVGLGYLSMSRSSATLSGGESQRIRLATQIGSPLMGVMYILDEPSIGLHQRDNAKLLTALKKMRDRGNTVLVVEHDAETIMEADYVVDLGPGAGENGGRLVCAGPPEEILKNPASLTGQYLSGALKVPVPKRRRTPAGQITLKGARANNLQNLTVSFPAGVFTCVTGVSGSGKSSLVLETLFQAINFSWKKKADQPFDEIQGAELINKVIDIDQSPIGRTPRSNPATYTGLFTPIRTLFSQLPESRARGYGPGRFSFNVSGGRCQTCEGDGILKIEMHFLPDVYVKCEACGGRRYNRSTLEIKYNGASIADVLEMPVSEAMNFFRNLPFIRDKLATLLEVGLGYIRLGQAATTLSGGEAQRIKLSKELSRRSTGRTLYILDEPTTGLHFDDVRKLLEVLQKLVDQGNTVVVIEHNLDVIKSADYIIDLGPEGGSGGGLIVTEGTPEKVAAARESYTGRFLKKVLKAG
ncbi:MAG: excinuclease ABC subunit UvrA [Deltaproteobacteria bacterium]|nr:excinuclease ABC subunit UvrA [Deltaproteobacteria bacterium]